MLLSRLVAALLPYLQLLAVISFFTFVLSIIFIPWYIRRLPSDFFYNLQNQRPDEQRKQTHLSLLLLRNSLGVILILAGGIMLFMPGQGILTILIGILCMSFPGKISLIQYLISKPSIQNSLNWTREKMRQKPFSWKD